MLRSTTLVLQSRISLQTRGTTPRRVSFDDVPHELAAVASAGSNDEEVRWLLEASRQLPLPLRQVLLLQLEGFEYKEIADMLGISVDNVGVRAHRARKQLQEIHDGHR